MMDINAPNIIQLGHQKKNRCKKVKKKQKKKLLRLTKIKYYRATQSTIFGIDMTEQTV